MSLKQYYPNLIAIVKSIQIHQNLDMTLGFIQSNNSIGICNNYTQQFFFLQCFQKHIFNKFNCSIIHFPSFYKSSGECKLNDSTDVFSEIFYSLCLPLCPLECYKNSFKTSVSSYTIFSLKYIKYIKSNPNLASDFTRSEIDSTTTGTSFSKVNIFYESLSYVLTTESPKMDIISLLASIGGNLGLFLGVSVFSLRETIEVIE